MRSPLSEISAETLLELLQGVAPRTFTKQELRKVVRSNGYRLDLASKRYWHPTREGWICIPPGRGVLPCETARFFLRPLLESVQRERNSIQQTIAATELCQRVSAEGRTR